MTALLSLSLLLLSADPAPTAGPVAECDAAFVAHDQARALRCFDDNASVVLVVDPVAPGITPVVPDEVFRGKDAIAEFLEVYLPGLTMAPGESNRLTVSNDALRSLGVDSATVTRDSSVLGPKVATLTWRFDEATRNKLVFAIPAQNKAVVRRFYDGINRGDRGIFDQTVSPNFVQHTVMSAGAGREGLKAYYEEFWKAFPTAKFTIEDVIAEGNTVAARITGRYVHKGTFQGIPATNKTVVLPRIAFFRVWGGRIEEHWDQADRFGLLQQLGAAPQLPTWSTSPGYDQFR